TAVRVTVNSVCSSAAGAASPPAVGPAAAATAIGTAALMPNSSSMAFTASTTSRMLQSLSASTKSFGVILVAAIVTLPPVLSCTRSALQELLEGGFAGFFKLNGGALAFCP